MKHKHLTLLHAVVLGLISTAAHAQETIKIGFLAPLTGQFAQNGRQMVAGLKYFLEENGTDVAGKKIEVIIRDDGGSPEQAKRIAQENSWPLKPT